MHVATDLGIFATTPQPLPFGRSLEIRSFVLPREGGNILVYSNERIEEDAGAIAELGGISRHFLNHHHEAMFPSACVDAPLFVHAADRGPVAGAYDVRGTFDRRFRLDDDFEVIPIPGHTPGATAFLWERDGRRLLFTGDSLMVEGGQWRAAVLESSDRESYLDSLELLRDLRFDVLVPWASKEGEPVLHEVSEEEAQRQIGAVIERVRAGADS